MNCILMMFIRDDDTLLLQHRDCLTGIKYPGFWAIPGGGVENNESVIEALLREAKEEIVFGQEVSNLTYSYVGCIINEWRCYEYIFVCYCSVDEVIGCSEGQGFAFVPLKDVDDSDYCLPPHHRKALQMLYRRTMLNNSCLKEECFMKNDVRAYVSITKLGTEKNPREYEATGKGYLVKKGNALTGLYYNGDPVTTLAYIEFEPGKTRGDHYHHKKVENMCVVKGHIRAQYMLPSKPEDILTLDLVAGDVVHILPGCAHSYMADEWSVALEYSPQKFEIADTVDIDFNW